MVGGDPQRPSSHGYSYSTSTGMSSAVRSPSGSSSPSPTDGAGGLSRRLSWNSSQGEAISMRDLAGSVLVGGSTPGLVGSGFGATGGPGAGGQGIGGGSASGPRVDTSGATGSGADAPAQAAAAGAGGVAFAGPRPSSAYDNVPVRQHAHSNSHSSPLPSPLSISELGVGVGGSSFHTAPRIYDSVGSTQAGYAASMHSEENDLEHLTPHRPDSVHGGRSPSGSRRVYDSEGRARTSPLGRIARSPTVRRVSNTLRFAGERVVNIMGTDSKNDKDNKGEYENLTRIPTGDDDSPISPISSQQLPLRDSPSPPPMYNPRPPTVGLRGRTLGMFTASNPLRRAMDRILRFSWTEPFILTLIVLNVIVLTTQSTPGLFTPRTGGGYFHRWEDYALFALFIIFTVEMFGRIIVTGLIIDPETKTSRWWAETWDLFMRRAKAEDDPTQPKKLDTWQGRRRNGSVAFAPPKPKRTMTTLGVTEAPFQSAVERQHDVTAQNRPYLRHSWHRIDMLAIVMFWITFILAVTGQEITASRHLYIFRALSVLRATRLLVITSGTATILHSLKRAGPLILNVSVFIVFAAALFSIIGVQTFRGSLRRTCVIVDPNNPDNNLYLNNTCGGWINPDTLQPLSFFKEGSDQLSPIPPKGFICPIGQQCHTVSWTQQDGSESFDNIFMSLVQVLIVAGVNTWTSTMYLIMSSEYFGSCMFFIVAIVVLNFWLMNLLVAVVVNTFKDIRSETKKSAFGADTTIIHQPEWAAGAKKPREPSWLLKWYNKTQIVWVLLVVVDIMAQAFKTADSSPRELRILRQMDIAFAIVWDVEMIIRIVAYLPDWQAFLRSGRNDFDLFLAVGTSIIQIPPIRRSTVYPWLTVLQLLRWYRFILVFPRMRPLLINIFGSFAGMLNMVIFLFMMNFLSALMLLRGDLDNEKMINFSQAYNAFLGMYQIFSTENWTTVLYDAMQAEWGWGQGWIVCIFLMIWFLFANFILMQMFIAVINENFEIAEELKRKEQIEAFVRKTEPKSTHLNWIDRLNPYRLIKARHKAVKVDELPPNLILPLKQSIGADVGAPAVEVESKGAKAAMRRIFGLGQVVEAFPMRSITGKAIMRSSSAVNVHQDFDDDYDDDRGLTDLLPPMQVGPGVDEHMDAVRERRNQQADFISAHPSFDKSLWLFKQSNPIRQMCQAIVPPAYGERIFGRPAKPLLSLAFRVLLLLAVIASIVVFAIATPHYRRNYYAKHGDTRVTWFDMTEMALGSMFVIEAVIKIIADGFIFAPNAYLLSLWNLVDFVILITIIINTACSFIVVGGVSRATRALKAFRAFRLITLFSRLRDTFHAVFFAGASRIVDASVLMILYIIPFAIWGLNIFSGRMASCNDGGDNIIGAVNCVSEFMSAPIDESLEFLAPRVWANPSFGGSIYAFDTFREAMLILFEIVSLEGWTDVMGTAMSIVGHNLQPQTNNQQWNSIFFVIFNLFGACIILTVFLSIIIENFSIRSGSALLTTEQNQWSDLAKFIRQQTPSQLPRTRPQFGFRAWCYDRATDKRGYWTRFYTVLYFVHIVLLMLQDYSNNIISEVQLDWVFLVLTVVYAIDIVVRFVGLGFHSFRSNGWNLFDVVVITGCFVTTIPALQASLHNVESNQATKQVQKLFLVSVSLKLVQRLDGLNQLFKTSVASLPAIGNLFLLWAVVFLFMAVVMMEIFGLTKMGNNAQSVYQNYHNFGSALVMLAFMSTGEGWNAYMHDYTVEYPRCTANDNWLQDDCGAVGWAYVLFIFWNILSMYIILNMFTGVVVQSFAYVYQSPGGASLTREQIRSFKRVWAEIDTDRTGYIRRKDFTRFFSKLTGVFEVRLYPAEYSISSLLRSTVPDPDTPAKRIATGAHYSVDVRKLRHQIAQIDYVKVRERRRQYVRLFNEAKMSAEPGRGISFTSMLMMLAHYKLIDDEKALQVDELLVRRAKMERVEDLVNLDRVRGLLRTIYWRRRFIQSRIESRILAAQQDGIPAIVLDPTNPDEDRDPLQTSARTSMYQTPAGSAMTMTPSTPPQRDRSSATLRSPRTPPRESIDHPLDSNLSVSTTGSVLGQHANTSNTSYTTALTVTPTASERGGPSPNHGQGHGLSHSVSYSRSPRHSSDSRHSYSSEATYRYSQRESVYESEGEDEVLSSMSNNAWANMMRDAVHAEGDDED